MKTSPSQKITLMLAWLMTLVFTIADELKADDFPDLTLVARDITEPAETHHVHLVFPNDADLDPGSLSDGDLLLLGEDNFQEQAQFEGFIHEMIPFPFPLDSLPSDIPPPLIHPPAPVLIATYRFDGPGGSWTESDNGIYRVRLTEGAITHHDGHPFETRFLGGFRCAIGDPNPETIQPTETRIVFHQSQIDGEVRYLSDVIMTFPTPQVRLVQGDLERTGNRFVAPITAYRLPIPDPANPIIETSADVISGDSPEDEITPFAHRQTLTFRLGALDPGTYNLLAKINGISEADDAFTIPTDPAGDEDPPEAELDSRDITVSSPSPQQFSVTYADESGVDLSTLGNGDVMVLSPCLEFPDLADDPCPSSWKAQRARLVNIIPLDPSLLKVRVTYEVEPPNGAWTAAANGSYPVVWREGEVCDALGNCNRYQRLGGFEVTIDESNPPIEADAQISVDASDPANVLASVHVRLASPFHIVSQSIRRDDNQIFLLSEALEAPGRPPGFPGSTSQENLSYEIGPLLGGDYVVRFFINGHPYATDNIVISDPGPPIEAQVDLDFQTNSQPSTATVTIQFLDHYRVNNPRIKKTGNFIVLLADIDGPLPILSPLPPAPITLTYDLGDLAPGNYVGSFIMNDHRYAHEEFKVTSDSTEVNVDLTAEVNETVTVTAVVDFEDPFILITEPGTPRVEGNIVHIDATAQRVDFFAPPSGDPQIIDYDLGPLPARRYQVIYSINQNTEARASFVVPEICELLPHLASIRNGEEDGQSFVRVALALTPGQQVLDWGQVRQIGHEFHVDLSVACLDTPAPATPGDDVPIEEVPDGFQINEDGTIIMGGAPVQLASQAYQLGALDSGPYKFFVHSQGITLGCHRFVRGGNPPEVQLAVTPVTEESDEHRFSINFNDHTGLDHASIQDALVWITGPNNYREEARLIDYISTDDDPSTSGFASYAVNGPDGSWDRPDAGGYHVFIDSDKILDLQGNVLTQSLLGSFRVSILAQPEPGVAVTFSRNDAGNWLANVEILPPLGQALAVDSWGSLVLHGHSVIALATVHHDLVAKPSGPLRHSYDLGPLQPGYYVFVFKSNLAHCGIGELVVPGVEGSAFDRWLALTGEAPDDIQRFAHYYFASPTPDLRAELVEDQLGRSHLGIRFRRLTGAEGVTQTVQASRDLTSWDDVTNSVDLVERSLEIDGTESVLLCLRQALDESPYRFVRIVVKADE